MMASHFSDSKSIAALFNSYTLSFNTTKPAECFAHGSLLWDLTVVFLLMPPVCLSVIILCPELDRYFHYCCQVAFSSH